MTKYETLSIALSGLAALCSFVALFLAWKANNINSRAIITNVRIAQRQNAVDLSKAWENTDRILNDGSAPIVPNVVRVVNALSETAAAWNHDIIDKVIIHQLYWHSFKDSYEAMYHNDRLIVELAKRYKDLITPDIQKAYQDMHQFDLNSVTQTRML